VSIIFEIRDLLFGETKNFTFKITSTSFKLFFKQGTSARYNIYNSISNVWGNFYRT
jgi:hypothetical protein